MSAPRTARRGAAREGEEEEGATPLFEALVRAWGRLLSYCIQAGWNKDIRQATNGAGAFMQALIDILERCIRQATFVSDRLGPIRWDEYRQLYRRRRWNDATWMLLATSKLKIDERHVADLATRLEPILAEFLHAGTGRFGNGLFLLLGGMGKWAQPTVAEFARTLIVGAVKLGARQVAELLLRWAAGEPLRYRISALLEGVDIDGSLHLAEGISLVKLPKSSEDLPASLPHFPMGATVTDFLGGVVMSIDCEMSPALYLPDENEGGKISDRRRMFRLASGRVPDLSMDNFCESMSLACNGYVDWLMEWKDLGDLQAFSDMLPGVSYKYRSNYLRAKMSQADLSDALKIHHARRRGGGPKENLELAIRRWIKSKRPGTDPDKLIELRIALEALYEIGGVNEKGFRIAIYGAWHLGESFEQRHEFRETLRKVYSDSSHVVHGGKIQYATCDEKLISSAQEICRNGILKRLQESEKPKWEEMILGAGE